MNYKYGKQTLLRVSVTIESLYLYRIYDVIYYGTYNAQRGVNDTRRNDTYGRRTAELGRKFLISLYCINSAGAVVRGSTQPTVYGGHHHHHHHQYAWAAKARNADLVRRECPRPVTSDMQGPILGGWRLWSHHQSGAARLEKLKRIVK